MAAPKYLQSGTAQPQKAPNGVLVTTPSPAYELSQPRGLLNPGESVATHPNIATPPPPLVNSVLTYRQ